MIETHAHIYLPQFNEDLDEVIERAKESGIQKIFMPNIDSSSVDDMLELENRYPGYCFPMMGLHPCSVKEDFEKELKIVEEWLSKRTFAAVGEMGTDLYWDKSFFEQQKEAFTIQCGWAVQYDSPIVIHCRESIDETIDLLEKLSPNHPRGVFHCFTGNLDQAKRILDLGFVLGIGGVATFKNGGMEPVLNEVALENLVLETDSPYLAPVPNRGKRNEPSYVQFVAQKIAEVKDVPVSKVIEQTSRNAELLFSRHD